jgi:DNA-binding CsgD family transcriptional regulator
VVNGERSGAPENTKMTILNLLLEGSKTTGEIADKLKIQERY